MDADSFVDLDTSRMWYIPLLLFAYVSDILNIILSIKFYYCGETSYAITFWIIFSLDKLIIMISSFSQINRQKLTFLAFDLLNLGWVYLLFTKKISQSSLFSLAFRFVVSRGVIQNIIQFIFFFYLTLLKKEKIGLTYRFIAYYLYMAQAIFYISQISYYSMKIKSKINFQLVKNFIAIFTCHLTLISFSYLEDQNGVKLIYYNFIIMVLQYIFILYFFKKVKTGYTHISIILNILHNNCISDDTEYRNKYMQIANFLAQVSRFTIFMVVAVTETLREIKHNQNFNQNIFSINNLITITSNSIYFVLFLYLIISKQLSLKVIMLKDNSNLETVNIELSLIDYEFTKEVEITLNDGLNYIDINQLNQNIVCDDNLCEEYYKMHKKINKIQKESDIKIFFTNIFYIQCYYHLQYLFSSEEEINSNIIFYLKAYSINLTLSKIVMIRMLNGFIFNTTNNIMISFLTEQEQVLLKEFQSYVLSVKALEKCFKAYSQNYIPQIIYDIQET
ncbi:hypothetical protein ABPG72_016191 [Tetrahymena utriculariae]